jgi:hypothetical protein
MKSMTVAIVNPNTGRVNTKPITVTESLLIQCKNLKVERPLKKEEADRLKKLAKQCGATPLLASNKNHKLNIVEVE